MDDLYTISQFAKKVNVSASTLRCWDKTGEFKAKKHKSGHQYYNESDKRKGGRFTRYCSQLQLQALWIKQL